MVPGFERKWEDSGPHYEVWYGKVNIAPHTALWFRYTLLDGRTREASTWAVLFREEGPVGGRTVHDLDALAPPHTVIVPDTGDRDRFLRRRQVFHVDENAHLDEGNALGTAGEIGWDLRWADSGRRFRYLPHMFNDAGVIGSTYDACFLDLRVSGVVSYDGEEIGFEGRPGMLGHIQGQRIVASQWGWAHCNAFDDDEDAVFEGLSLEMLLGKRTSPPLSIFVAYVDGHRYTFNTPLSILRAKSTFARGQWRFQVKSRGVTLSGEAYAPTDVAVLEYQDTDDSNLWCYNSKLADLSLHLVDPKRRVDRRLQATGASAYEFVTRDPPTTDVLI